MPRSLFLASTLLAFAACAGPYDGADDGALTSSADDGSEAPLALQSFPSVTFAGSGCRVGDTSYNVTSDGRTYTFNVPKLAASTGSQGYATSDCSVMIRPSDTRLGVYRVTYEGPADVPDGANGSVNFVTYVQGQPTTSNQATHRVDAPESSSHWVGSMLVAPSAIISGNGQRYLTTTVRLAVRGSASSGASLGGESSTITVELQPRG